MPRLLQTHMQVKFVLWATRLQHLQDEKTWPSEQGKATIIWVVLLGKRRQKNKLMVEKGQSEDSLQLFSCSETRIEGCEHARAT